MKKILKGTISLILMISFIIQKPYNTKATYRFYVVSEKQEKSNWCWIATARGIASLSALVHNTQAEGVAAVKGSVKNVGGKAKDIEAGAEFFSDGLNFTVISRPLTFYEIKKEIDKGHLIGVTWGYYIGNKSMHGHAVFIVGYNDNDGKQEVIYCDPETGGYEHEEYDKMVSKNVKGEQRIYERSIYANYK